MGAPASWLNGMPEKASEGVRLSPVELRNFALINDPALEGLHGQDASNEGIGSIEEPSSACNLNNAVIEREIDETLLARIEADHIEISPKICSIQTGQEGPIAHERISVHPDNPHFMTDGKAVYTKDGKELVCMVVPGDEYEILPGCMRIGDRAFDAATTLKSIRLPHGLCGIGRLAFAKSGIEFIDIPDSVVSIEEKAFFGCKNLKACILGNGLSSIGESAFELSSVERIRIPRSVSQIGIGAFDRTPAKRNAPSGAISIAKDNPFYEMDVQGGLYKNARLEMILSDVSSYRVKDGCIEVQDSACKRNINLVEVVLADSVIGIGDDAFNGCSRLKKVELPGNLRSIGKRAFMNTDIDFLAISRTVEHIGEGALLVGGENPSHPHHPLRMIELDPGNEHFYVEDDIFCERDAGSNGADKVLLYIGPKTIVSIPDKVNRIAPYAFLGAKDIEELHVHGHLHSICAGAFSVARSVPFLSVDIPVKWTEGVSGINEANKIGEDKYRVRLIVPSLNARFRNYSELFTTEQDNTIFIFPYYDAWVTNTKDVAEFATAAIKRLREPIWMREDTRDIYLGIFERRQEAVCKTFAQMGELEALVELNSWGVLSPSTVDKVLEAVTGEMDAQAIACLLELKQRCSFGTGLDLEI